jgi:transcription antitermination factor NusG
LIPLFSGYLFFCGNEDNRLEVLRTNRVAGLIEVKDSQAFVSELWSIEKALVSGVSLEPYKFISAGQRCKVIAGPLMGAEGIVIKEKGQARLIMQVDILGQATSVEIEFDMLEIID